MAELEVGTVNDFFARVSVAGIALTGQLKVGDTIRIRGHTTDIEQTVESMQIERQDVAEAGPGQAVGVMVKDRCRRGDQVYKVVPD